MKIDKNALAALADMSDEELWASISGIATGHGYRLKESCPSHGEMERIRALLRDSEKINLREAIRLLNTYKRGNTNGRG